MSAIEERISRAEFIALAAMMFATIAFSIDAMLPALPQIGEDLSPGDVNRAQLIITSFVLGMGVGTAIAGPLSDAFGRKPVIFSGGMLYIAGAALAWVSASLEWVLVGRLAMGLGAAGPRVVTLAVIRDLFVGREMARMMSFVMIVFTLVPAAAPLLGAVIINGFGWRAVFAAFILFSVISMIWMSLRLPETLRREDRRPFQAKPLKSAIIEIFAHPAVRAAMAVQTLIFSMFFAMLSSVQPIYDLTFGRAESFPLWFGALALFSASSGFLNARLVLRFGMRRLIGFTLWAQVVISGSMVLISLAPIPEDLFFGAFVFWQFSLFFMMGMTMGNLNAIAMEPMGHIAGTAASIIGAVATVFSVALAAPLGLAFDGTPLPLALGLTVLALLSVALLVPLNRSESAPY